MSGRRGDGLVVVESINNELSSEKYLKCEVSAIKHSYPLKFLIPSHASETNCCWIYPISYGGGLVEGDHIEISINLKTKCSAVVTTQESTKVYECGNNITTYQKCKYYIEEDALLCLLGDPIVCFKSANFDQTQEVHVSSGGSVVLLDWLLAGRIARGEKWQFTSFKNKISVFVDDQLVLNEVNHLENTPTMSLVESMRNYEVYGTCVILGKDVEELVNSLLKKYSRKKPIGEVINRETICSISKLKFSVKNNSIQGCYLRFLTSTSKVYDIINDITEHLLSTIGNDPYYNKY